MKNELEPNKPVLSRGRERSSVVESSEDCDDALMKQVAQERSEKAFETLYQRYHKRLYNLAYYMTRNEHMAQDATQEALVDLWASAKNYRSGNAKGWITMILVRNILDRRKSRQGEIKRIGRRAQKGFPEKTVVTPPQQLEQHERMKGLRSGLACLGVQDRSLVALYFGGELSQTEIGRITGIPQTTVSSHIKRIMAELQEHCRRAGLMGSAVALEGTHICDVIASGNEVPIGLFENVISRIESGKATTKSVSGSASMWWAGAGVTVLVFGICANVFRKQEGVGALPARGRSATTVQRPAGIIEAPSVTPANDSKLRDYLLEFPVKKMADIDDGNKCWKWLAPSKTRPGRMTTGPGKEFLLRFPPMNSRYFHLKVEGSGVRNHSVTCNIAYSYNGGIPSYRYWLKRKNSKVSSFYKRIVFEFYRNDHFTLLKVNGKIIQILEEFNAPTDLDTRVLLIFDSITVDRIELTHLELEEVSKAFRDPARYIDKSWVGPRVRQVRGIIAEN